MIKVTRTYTRPNTNVAFHTKVINASHLVENYDKTKKRLYIKNELSEDRLSLLHIALWDSHESYEEHRRDPKCIEYFNARDAYNQRVGITQTETLVEDL